MIRQLCPLSLALAVLSSGWLLIAAESALAQLAPGFATTQQSVDLGSSVSVGAVAFATDGTLYAVPSPFFDSHGNVTTVNSIDAVSPSGVVTPISLVDSSNHPVQLYGVGGATWDPYTQTLLVADNQAAGFGSPPNADQGNLYSIARTGANTATVTTIFTYQGDGNLAQVAVRGGGVAGPHGAGQIFVSDVYLNPQSVTQGSVFSVNTTPGQSFSIGGSGPNVDPNYVVPRGDLTYGAGIGFTADGHLIVQQLDSSFAGHVYSTSLTDGAGGPAAGPLTELPASANLAGGGGTFAYDLAVVNQNDVYVTGANFTSGAGGVVKTDTAPTTTSFTTVDSETNTTSISFLPGTHDFAPFAGAGAGLLAYVPDTFSGPDHQLIVITPVPEPSSVALAVVGALSSAAIYARRRRQRRRRND